MKTYVKIALAVVSLLAIGGILAALWLYNLGHSDLSKAQADHVITASLLLKEFEAGETEASARYVGKILEVTGKISAIQPGENNITNITLRTESPLSSVICTTASGVSTEGLSAGDEITLRGECSGFLMDVLLNNCSVIPKK